MLKYEQKLLILSFQEEITEVPAARQSSLGYMSSVTMSNNVQKKITLLLKI